MFKVNVLGFGPEMLSDSKVHSLSGKTPIELELGHPDA